MQSEVGVVNNEEIKNNLKDEKPVDIQKIHYEFSGVRKKGMYADKKLNDSMHADINGSYNIMRKALNQFPYEINIQTKTRKAFFQMSIPQVVNCGVIKPKKILERTLVESDVGLCGCHYQQSNKSGIHFPTSDCK